MVCWALAIVAALFETALVVGDVGGASPHGAALWVGAGVRLAVFAVATVLIVRLARGGRVARVALTVLLSIVGLASIVVPAAQSMADGHDLLEAFADGGRLPVAFAVSRLVHVAAVVAATVAMWWPGALSRAAGRES